MTRCSGSLLAEMVRRLVQALSPSRVYLFGSQAKDRADRESDIDLLVVVPDTEAHPRELARRGRRSLWGLRVAVDLVVCTESELEKWAHASCNLIHTAVENGRLLYGAGG